MEDATGAGPRVETSYTASPEVAARRADALSRWLLRRRSRGGPLLRRVVTLAVAVALIGAGSVLVSGRWAVGAQVALGAAVAVLLLQPVGRRLARRRVRALFVRAAEAGAVVRGRFAPDRLEVETPAATHRVELARVVGGAWVGRDLVLELPGPVWHVLPGELLSDEARALVEAALGDRLGTLP
ncbi:hypothetical protein [Nostocoides sp. Soil756]|uniref:hypothetical protein n=1 Tax=Nostocoides sp. Soil756 TaxID=1736399 RepID=UPI000700FBDA|nr:hypothetical protein [Tetrasphaera sp. Soil756]KRE62577.1 hypothetical protein ASG78_06070 [Tetrasphaera sp. Soil756]